MTARLPVRGHLRPKWRRSISPRRDLPPDLVAAYPDIMRELNSCAAGVFVGPGRPGRGWDGWTTEYLWLDDVLAPPVAG